nr:retrovirus-related Pol polyprotein from transposon TNT 1-94 [Tanacetum cinerariifolium]
MEPEEEDGDDEKSEEDSIDYPTSGGDNDANDDDFLEDDADDEEEEESSDSKEEKEEHLAPTVPAPALMLKTVTETPQQNGVAERMKQTLNERAKRFRIPEEEWQGKKVSLANLTVFGCDSYVKVKDVGRDKLDAKSVKVQFLGHMIDSRGIHIDPAKIESVKDWASTKAPTEIR